MDALSQIPGNDSLLELPRFLANPSGFLEARQSQFGDVFRTRLLFPVVFAVGPEANQQIHITERAKLSYEHGFGAVALGRVFERSLIVEDGVEHKRDRDILPPAVGRLGLQQSIERVQQIWDRGAKRLADEPVVDAYEYARDVTFEVSANALVDVDIEELGPWRVLFEKLIGGAMAHTKVRWPFLALDRGLDARSALIEKMKPLVDEARKREPRGMLGLLAHYKDADGNLLTSERVAEHVLLLFWAGYDTTASTGSWLLTELALHPEWQDRLNAERERVLGDRPFSVEDAEKLVEHGWFLKEIERYRPAVLLFPRMVMQDVSLLGHTIPKGTMIFWSPYLSHRLQRIFPEPHRFDPTRWDPSRAGGQAPSTALVGFGGGPRICLGKAFALMQLRVLMTTLIRRYRISLANKPDIKIVEIPTYRPKDVRLRFTPR